jgi:hypothetical protein
MHLQILTKFYSSKHTWILSFIVKDNNNFIFYSSKSCTSWIISYSIDFFKQDNLFLPPYLLFLVPFPLHLINYN